MTAFFLQIIGITAAMSVLILFLLLLSRIAGAKFTAKCRYIIWAVVILRLAVPVGMGEGWLLKIELPVSDEVTTPDSTDTTLVTQHQQQKTQPQSMETTPNNLAPALDFENNSETGAKLPVVDYESLLTVGDNSAYSPELTETSPVQEFETAEEPTIPDEIEENEQTTVKSPIKLTKILDIIAIVYILGAVFYIIVRTSSHIVYTTSVQRQKKRVSAELYDEYHALCDTLYIKRHPALYSSGRADSPMLFGYFRPQIVIPTAVTNRVGEYSFEKYRGILAHELTHYKRGDIWLKLVAMIAEALHWFNPLVHIASRRCEQEMELACDEAVLNGMDENARVDYGYAMLDIVKHCRNRQNTLSTQYSPKKTALKERFENILDTSHKRRGVLIIVLSVILCAAAGLAISCTVGTPDEQETDVTNAVESYLQTVDIYHCSEAYGGTVYGIYGAATVEMPMNDEYTVTEFDVRYCFDGCEQTNVLSRAVWGYDPAYSFEEYREHSDWNYPTREYINEIPEDQLDRFSEEQIERLTERVYIYLLTLDDEHYAVLTIEPKDKTKEMPENEAELVNTMVAGAVITMQDSDSRLADSQAQQLYRQLRELYAARDEYITEEATQQARIESYESELALLDNRRMEHMNSSAASADKESDNYKALMESIDEIDKRIADINEQIDEAEMNLRSTKNSHNYVEELIASTVEHLRSAAPNMLYERYGMIVMMPDAYFDAVTVVPVGELDTHEVVKFYQTSVMDQGIGWLFSIVRHKPEEVLTTELNAGGCTYFAHDEFYWYATLTPTDVQVDITSQEHTDEYNALFEMMDGVKNSFKLANDLTIADNTYADHMAKTYYSQDSHTLYDNMTSADDWNDVIDAPSVREEVSALVNELLDIYRNGGSEEELREFLTYPSSDHTYPEGAGDVPYISPDAIPFMFGVQRTNPVVSVPLANGWYMEILLTILDWGSQYVDYANYDGRDMSIADVYFHNIKPVEEESEDETEVENESESTENELVSVISNDGGLDINTLILPLTDENSLYTAYSLDEKHKLYLTYNIVRNDENIQSYTNVRVYVIDAENSAIAGVFGQQGEFDADFIPDRISYTENGCVLRGFNSATGYAIEQKNGVFSMTEIESEFYPSTERHIKSPSGTYIAALVSDDRESGGIDLITTSDGSVKRILQNNNTDSVQSALGYTPIAFLDETHLVYTMIGWESFIGYGIYDITTGETSEVSGYNRPYAVHDGALYVAEINDGEYDYDYRSVRIWKTTLDGEKTLAASTDENDGVKVLDMDKYFTYDGDMWRFFHTGMIDGYAYSAENSRMTAELYSPDLTEKLAEIEFSDNGSRFIENLITYGDTATVVVPAVVKERAESTANDLITVISNNGGMLTNAVALPIYGEDSGYRTYKFNDRYSLFLTYSYTRENGNIESYDNIMLYMIDTQNGNIAYQTALETEFLPDYISYTENGCELYESTLEGEEYIVRCAYLVEVTDDGFSVSEAEYEHLPYTETLCKTPTTGIYAADVVENGYGDGGIDLFYPDGTVKRIFENTMLNEVGQTEWGEFDLSNIRGYTPLGFLDDEHLAYSIGGWEWHYGYGIYNITTGETVVSGEERPLAVHDGVLFVEDFETASDGTYETLSSKFYAVTADGEKKLIASTDESDGVFVLPLDKYTVFEGSTWQMFSTGRFSGWNHSDVASDNMTVEVYSPDFSVKLAEIEYPHNYTFVENFITYGNSVTVVVPVKVEETSETSEIAPSVDVLDEHKNTVNAFRELRETMQAENRSASEQYERVTEQVEKLSELYGEIMNERSELFSMIEESETLWNRVKAGDLSAEEQALAQDGAYDQLGENIEIMEDQYYSYSVMLDSVVEEYENWRDYRYTLEESLYDKPSARESADTLFDMYLSGDITMHALMQYEQIAEEAAVKLNTALAAILAGNFEDEIFEFAAVSDIIFPYGTEIPTKIDADEAAELFREIELTEDERYRFEIPVSSVTKLVLAFDIYEYQGETDFFFTAVRTEIKEMDLDLDHFAFVDVRTETTEIDQNSRHFADYLEKKFVIDGEWNGSVIVDYKVKTAFVSYLCGETAPVLYFTMDGREYYEAQIEIPAEYEYTSADIVNISGSDSLYTVVQLESNGIYTYLEYSDSGEVFDGVLSLAECQGMLKYDHKIPDYIKFPHTNFPNMTDDVNDFETLGVDEGYTCYQRAKEYLVNEDDYIVWFDGSGIHIIMNRSELEQEYKFIRATDGGDIAIVDSFPQALYLYNRAVELGHDGNSMIYQAIRAMLMSDGKFMGSMMRVEDGSIEVLFDSFKATMHSLNHTPDGYPSDELALTLTVEQSEIERLAVGTYTIIVKSNFDGLVIEEKGVVHSIQPEPITDEAEAIWMWLRSVGMAEIPLDGDMTDEELTNFKRAATEYACRHADGTIESIKNAVKTCFGSEDYFTDEILSTTDGIIYGIGGHGAARHSYDWLAVSNNEDGSVSVKVRFYADVNKFVKAKDIEYIVREVGEDMHGQTIYAFEECNIIEDYGSKLYFMWT